ncbi:MAG: hypothetical protein V4474_04050 [Patescibacteria group bacterium]
MSDEQKPKPHIVAYGGGGGGGGGGPGGGQGGAGGSVVIGILPGEVTIHNVPNLHSNYWKHLIGTLLKFIFKHIVEIIIGVLIIAIASWFGLSQ